MTHWSTPWLAKRWVEGEYECVHFVAEVLDVQFGVDVAGVPAAPAGVRVRDATLREGLRERARPTDTPLDGDLVLMTMAGGVRMRAYHLGIYVAAGGGCVLHLDEDGAFVHRIDELATQGLALEGYYRCTP